MPNCFRDSRTRADDTPEACTHTLFLKVGFSTKNLTLRLCAKIISAPNVKYTQRLHIHRMIVELLGRYHSIASCTSMVPCSMCPSFICHLARTFIPPPSEIKYTDVPLQLYIFSLLLSHGQLLCLCKQKQPAGGAGGCGTDTACSCARGNLRVGSLALTHTYTHT